MAKPPPYAPRPVRKNENAIRNSSASTPGACSAIPSITTKTVQLATFISVGGFRGSDFWVESVAPSSGRTTGASRRSRILRRSIANRRARLVPRSTASPTPIATNATSPGGASPRTEKRSAPAATPICQRRETALLAIFRVMAPMIPITAALKPPSKVATLGAVPKCTYRNASAITAIHPGNTKPR